MTEKQIIWIFHQIRVSFLYYNIRANYNMILRDIDFTKEKKTKKIQGGKFYITESGDWINFAKIIELMNRIEWNSVAFRFGSYRTRPLAHEYSLCMWTLMLRRGSCTTPNTILTRALKVLPESKNTEVGCRRVKARKMKTIHTKYIYDLSIIVDIIKYYPYTCSQSVTRRNQSN